MTNQVTSNTGDAITRYVDFINPMCYDYHGGWEPTVTGAHAALYDQHSNLSTEYGIRTWKQDGVVSGKIVMGMPAYGRTWQLQDPNEHGIGAPANGTGPGGGMMTYSDIIGFNCENNATVVFDNTTVSTYSYVGNDWIGYDDITSIQQKIKFAKDQKLVGYFFWALGFDTNWDLAKAGISDSFVILSALYIMAYCVQIINLKLCVFAASMAWDSDDESGAERPLP